MKEQRIVFLRKAKGTNIMGITQGEYVVDGQPIAAEKGGGKIASMVLKDGMIYIRKVDAEGKPHRKFGSVALPGGVMKPLIADGIAFPAHLTSAILFEDVEVAAVPTAAALAEKDPQQQAAQKEPDPPPAKPIQQSRRQ
jgi:hypothetical protein